MNYEGPTTADEWLDAVAETIARNPSDSEVRAGYMAACNGLAAALELQPLTDRLANIHRRQLEERRRASAAEALDVTAGL